MTAGYVYFVGLTWQPYSHTTVMVAGVIPPNTTFMSSLSHFRVIYWSGNMKARVNIGGWFYWSDNKKASVDIGRWFYWSDNKKARVDIGGWFYWSGNMKARVDIGGWFYWSGNKKARVDIGGWFYWKLLAFTFRIPSQNIYIFTICNIRIMLSESPEWSDGPHVLWLPPHRIHFYKIFIRNIAKDEWEWRGLAET